MGGLLKTQVSRRAGVAAICAAFAPFGAHAALDEARASELARLSLEELMQVEVTTVIGSAQARASAPAALYVVTADDIRRSGHRTLAEALRLVPGMYLGKTGSSSWVIGARGLTGSAITATRYLVMIDGRVVHDPLISATFWDTTDVPLADIDRIEVIRGPGATLWGANAMNGVVNVISKSAHATQGGFALVGAGDYEERYATLRYGGGIGAGAFRAFAKYTQRDGYSLASGVPNGDAWSTFRTGIRVDAPLDDRTGLVVDAHVYEHPVSGVSARLPVPGRHDLFEQVAGNDDVSGAHLLARIERADGPDARTTVQAYYDGARRSGVRFGLDRDTLDLDLRQWRRWGERHELVYGVQFNRHSDRITNGPSFQFDPRRREWNTWNAFVQDTFPLGERTSATVGTKLTKHDFIGVEWQPGVRLSHGFGEDQTIWGAISRPIRVPSRFEEDGLIVLSYADTGLVRGQPASGVVVPLGLSGNRDLRAEKLVAYEVGHRIGFGDRLNLDTAVFYNDYRRLIGVPPGIVGSLTDEALGTTRGFDVGATFQATDRWRLEGSFSRIDVEIGGPVFEFEEIGTPKRLAQLRSYFDLGESFEINAAAYYVDEVPRIPADSYTRVDLGLVWRPRAGVELALVGQNLTERMHEEASLVQVPRSYYVQLTMRGRE